MLLAYDFGRRGSPSLQALILTKVSSNSAAFMPAHALTSFS